MTAQRRRIGSDRYHFFTTQLHPEPRILDSIYTAFEFTHCAYFGVHLTTMPRIGDGDSLLLSAEQAAAAGGGYTAQQRARLQAAAAALSEPLLPAQVADAVVSEGVASLGAHAGSVALLTEDGEALEVVCARGYPAELLDRWQSLPLCVRAPLTDAARTRQPVLLGSAKTRDKRYPNLKDRSVATVSPALAAIPLMVEGRVVGALGFSFARARRFGASERAFMLALAQQSARALERARLYTESERRRKEAEALAELARRGVSAGDTDQAVNLVTEQACRLLDADYGALALSGPHGTLTLHGIRGARPGGKPQRGAGRDQLRKALAQQRTVLIERFGDNPDFSPADFPIHAAQGARTILTTSLLSAEGGLGALVLGWRRDVRLSKGQVQFAEALADYAATILRSARLAEARDRALATAEAERSRLKSTFMDAPAIVAMFHGPEQVIELINPRASWLVGGRDVVGTPAREALPQLAEQGLLRVLDRVYTTGVPSSGSEFPITMIRGDGAVEHRFFNYVFQPVRGADESADGVLIYAVDVTEQVQARREVERLASEAAARSTELEASERRYRTIVETAQEGIWILDVASSTTFVNGKMAEMLGYTVAELQGASLLQFVDVEGQRHAEASIERWRRGGSEQHDFRFTRKDGSALWAIVSTTPLMDDLGRYRGALAMVADITGRRAVEQEVEARARQQAAVAALGQRALANSDLDGLMNQAVATVARNLGVELCEVMELLPDGQTLVLRAGVGWQEGLVGRATVVTGPDPESFAVSQVGYVLLANEPVIIEDLHTENRFVGTPLLLQHGAVSGMSVVIGGRERPFGVLDAYTAAHRIFTRDDINFLQATANVLAEAIERRKAEAAVRHSEERFRSLVQNASDIVLVLDADARLQYVSPSVERVLGYNPDQQLGTNVFDLVHPDDRGRLLRSFEGVRTREGVYQPTEFRVRHADGSWRYLEARANNLLDDPSVRGIVQNVHDITERRQAEEAIRGLNAELEQRVDERTAALEAANRELEAFSYSVSHDLRAPVRAASGFSRILLEEYGPQLPEDALRYVQRVQHNVQQMGQLVDDLLRFSRLSRQPLQTVPVSPARVVAEVLEELQPEQEGRSVEFTIGDLPACLADPALLKQVYLNLIGNALKYSRERQPALIEIGSQASNEPGRATFYVKDNGVGFDMRYADKLFGVFQRLHRAEDYEGTGVGLAIVQRIVHRHGGQIWAASAVGNGAAFYFTLQEGASA